jgi:hypothetical protein
VGECVVDGDEVIVCDGRGRVINMREANRRLREQGLPEIQFEYTVKRGDEDTWVESMIALNEHREETDPVTKSESAMQLFNIGRAVKDIAVTMNCDEETVRGYLKLAEMAKPVKELVRSGEIAATTAIQFHGLPRAEQLDAIKKVEAELGAENMTRGNVQRAVKNARASGEQSDAAALGAAVSQSNYALPSKRELRRLVLAAQSGRVPDLDVTVVDAIRCLVLGELHPSKIKGLSAALRIAAGKADAAQ